MVGIIRIEGYFTNTPPSPNPMLWELKCCAMLYKENFTGVYTDTTFMKYMLTIYIIYVHGMCKLAMNHTITICINKIMFQQLFWNLSSGYSLSCLIGFFSQTFLLHDNWVQMVSKWSLGMHTLHYGQLQNTWSL